MAVSEKPWSQFTAADYSPEQWARACLIDTGEGATDSKSRYKLPVREPAGALNRAGCHSAASVLAGGRGGVQASPEQKRAAARKLAAIYRNDLKEDPPDSLLSLARQSRAHEEGLSMPNETERRYTAVPVEARARDGKKKIGGYASVFNRYSQNLGGFVEQVDPAFFNKSRADGWPDVIARYNHDDNMLLGTVGGGTLTLSVDGTGLLYEVDPPAARADILELVERGDVRKSSFAFRAFEEDWTLTDQSFPLRTLMSGQLVDVAPVNMPAYTDSSAGLRALAEHKHAPLDEVRSLAEANDLRKLFIRTDNRGRPVEPAAPRLFGPAAALALLERQEDPWV